MTRALRVINLKQSVLKKPIVLLHGWGVCRDAWQPLLSELLALGSVISIDLPGFGSAEPIDDFCLDSVIEQLLPQIPDQAILLGWSLGGMLAVAVAARYPQKITAIITLAANVKFVADDTFATAMSAEINQHFNRAFAENPTATLKRFFGLLAQGDYDERALSKKMRNLLDVHGINKNWHDALSLLSTLDNREAFSQLIVPGLHLLGAADVLVPASTAESLQLLNHQQRVVVVSGTAHALHWSQPQIIVNEIVQFLSQKKSPQTIKNPHAIDKQVIANSFSRAARTYDAVALLQREVGEQLTQYCVVNPHEQIVVDLGCGTGHFVPFLQHRFPHSLVVGLDLAQGMVQFAREHHPLSSAAWLCADADHLPFESASVDTIFSNLAVQWCDNLFTLFAECNRVLKPGGQLIFSSLGPRTLHELKSTWAALDDDVHVNAFVDPASLYSALNQAGFIVDHFAREESVMYFKQLSDLTRSLKCVGAGNLNAGRPLGLSGRKKIEAFKMRYEQYRRDELLPATYDVYYVAAKKSPMSPLDNY